MNTNADQSPYLLPDWDEAPWKMLSPQRLDHALEIRDFMLGDGRLNTDPDITLSALSNRIIDAGVPL